MKVGGLLWFVAGFAFCIAYLEDGVDGLFKTVATAVGAIVTFVLTVGGVAGDGMPGVVAVLALIGVTLLVGREWSERARGHHDADEAWERRKKYRN